MKMPSTRPAVEVRDSIRRHLFETLMPRPKEAWPADGADLFQAGMDSLRLMQLLVYIEQKIGVNLPDHEVTPERVASIDSIVDWIGQHQRR
jgi:acyl carrier protein